MFVLKRNQVIITALVLMIAVAGYLSWSDSRSEANIGFHMNGQNEIDALIPDLSVLTGHFPDGYSGMMGGPIATTHNPAIVTNGEGGEGETEWPQLSDIDLDTNVNEAGEAIFVYTSSSSSFFVQARLNREQSRSGQRVTLNEIINNPNVEVSQRAEAADAMLEIQRRIEREAAAESLIEAKGFDETYVRINDNSVDVIVSRDSLTPADLAQIMDIIKRKTGMAETQIHISPMRR